MIFGGLWNFFPMRFGFSKQVNDRNKSIVVVGLLAHVDLGVL